MSPLSAGVRRALVWRSFLVQGSWNYETLIGTGFAFVLLPALRYVYRRDPAALSAALCRHTELFNSHPFLAGVAAGAVARLEAERADPEMIGRFKTAVRGSLGSLGDQVVWMAWRPACALLGLAVLLLGAPLWLGAAAFLLAYNALHVTLRVWGVRIGLEHGVGVGRVLRQAPLLDAARRAGDVGAFLAGFAAVAALGAGAGGGGEARGVTPLLWLALVALPLGYWVGLRSRRVGWLVVSVLWIAGLFYGLVVG